MMLFTKDIDKKLFQQYDMGSNLEKQKVIAKIFNPYSEGRWFLINSDPQDPDYLWAIVQMGDTVEVGSVSRQDLISARVGRFKFPLERDLGFSPVNAAELFRGLNQGKFYADGGETDEEQMVTRGFYEDEPYEYAKGGEVKWQDARIGDSARVKSENKMGLILKDYGRKFHLKFVDGTEKTYDASELEFIKDEDEYAKGGIVVTSIKDIPNFKKILDEGKITYRGLGLGKLWDDFNKLTGTTGKKIKVAGKEYFITDEEFQTFSRDADGNLRIRFAAPFKKSYADGGYMAKGGDIDGGKLKNGKYKYEKGDEGMFQGNEVRVVKYNIGYGGTYYYNIIDEDGKVKTHGVAKAEKFENQFAYFPKMAEGGYMAKGGELMSDDGDIPYNAIKKMQKIKINELNQWMPSIKYVWYDNNSKKFYFKDYLGRIMAVNNGGTLGELDRFIKKNNILLEDGKMSDGGYMAKGGKIVGYEVEYEKLVGGERERDIKSFKTKEEAEAFAKENYGYVENVYEGQYKMAKGGETMSTINEIGLLTGLRPIAIAEWGDKNNINLSLILKDLKSKKIKGIDLMTAIVGNKNNKYSIELLSKYSRMSMGGKVTFDDKVSSIKKSLLKKKIVSPKVQKDYGKTYNNKEALESARRIAGSMKAKYQK